jgi:hypothetical protein
MYAVNPKYPNCSSATAEVITVTFRLGMRQVHEHEVGNMQ